MYVGSSLILKQGKALDCWFKSNLPAPCGDSSKVRASFVEILVRYQFAALARKTILRVYA